MFGLFKKKTPAEPDRSSIVPRIKHTNMLAYLSEQNIPPEELPVAEPLVADLLVVYAFDLPALFQMITQRDLERLGLAPAELREIAVNNLRGQLTEAKIEGEPPVVMLTAGKDLGACMLLIDDAWEGLAQKFPGEVVVAVPTRGIILITSNEWPEGLALMRELTSGAQEREDLKHRLTDHFLVRREGAWVAFEGSA